MIPLCVGIQDGIQRAGCWAVFAANLNFDGAKKKLGRLLADARRLLL